MDLFNPFRSNPGSKDQIPNAQFSNQVHQSTNQAAARGAALWNGPQNHEFQGRTRYPVQSGPPSRGFFSGQQRGGRGQARGRFRGGPHGYSRGGPQRGAAFHNPRNNGSANPAPGLFRPQPENYYCETCDLEFRNQLKFDEHVKNHVKCPKCDFVGVFDSIEEHFEMIHLTVLKNRLKPVETEEELKLWREERRENYPRPKVNSLQRNQGSAAGKSTSLPQCLTINGCFQKISTDLSDGEIEEEEEMTVPPACAPSAANTLISLLGCYGEVDSDSEGPEEMPTSAICQTASQLEQSVLNPSLSVALPDINNPSTQTERMQDHSSGKTGQGDLNSKSIFDGRPSASSSTSSPRMKSQPYRLPAKRKPRTLYEKLVAKDIEKDNDMLIQCIAHLSRNF